MRFVESTYCPVSDGTIDPKRDNKTAVSFYTRVNLDSVRRMDVIKDPNTPNYVITVQYDDSSWVYIASYRSLGEAQKAYSKFPSGFKIIEI